MQEGMQDEESKLDLLNCPYLLSEDQKVKRLR